MITKYGNLNKETIKEISAIKKEPKWMTDFRIMALNKFFELGNPILVQN